MTFTDEGIMYAENCQIAEMNLRVTLEIVFKKTGDKSCIVTWRFINTNETPLAEENQPHLL